MADKIAVLRKGVVEQFGKPLDLFNRPDNRFVAGFIGSPAMNFARGSIENGAVKLDAGAVIRLPEGFTTQQGQKVELGIRASHMDVTPDGPIEVQANMVEQLGSESYIYGKLGDGAAFTIHQPGQVNIEEGTGVRVTPRPDMLHLFDAVTGLSLRE